MCVCKGGGGVIHFFFILPKVKQGPEIVFTKIHHNHQRRVHNAASFLGAFNTADQCALCHAMQPLQHTVPTPLEHSF